MPTVSIRWGEFFPVVIAYILLIAGVVSQRARTLYRRLMRYVGIRIRQQPAAAMWIVGFAIALLVVVLHPGLSDSVDRVAILTIAGMEVVAVSVTFGVLGIQAQHLAETYTRAVARQAAQNASWPTMLVAQALGIVFVTVSAIFSPTKATALAAALLLALGLAANALVVQEFLQRFDPIRLISLQRQGAISLLRRADTRNGEIAVGGAQPLLNLIVRGCEIGDTEVVTACMAAWKDILVRYLQVETPVWSDALIDWLFARSQELVETYAPRSAGVVLPTLIQGVADLGLVCGRYVNPLNRDHDEGTHAACRVLRRAVARSINADLSPSADLATASVTRLGEACIAVGKVVTLQEPIRILRHIGAQTVDNWPHVANRATSGLAQLAIEVALSRARDHMASECARQVVEALYEILAHPDHGLGAVHALTAPLANNTFPRLCYALETAARQDRGPGDWRWDQAATDVANLCFQLPARTDLYFLIRPNAAECCEEVLLVLLSMPYRQETARLITELFPRFTELVVGDTDGRLSTRRLFGELLLYTYYRSRLVQQAEPLYRELILTAAARVGGLEAQQRRQLAPVLRRLGAAAIHLRDTATATTIARESLPPMPVPGGRALRLPLDFFEPGGWAGETFHHRPGLPDLTLEPHHLDQAARRAYLRLEANIDRPQP
jgi:hypothetical protein